MKRFLFAMLALALAMPAWASKEKLVGRWEQVDRPKGAPGQFFVFQANGDLLMGSSAMFDGKYTRQGKTVTIDSPDGSKATFDAEFIPGGMTRTPKQGVAIHLKRVGAVPAKDPLIGAWTYEYHLGGPAYEIFEADGTYRFRYPFKNPVPGYYKLNGEKLGIRLQDQRVLRLKVAFRGDKLVLIDELGNEVVYARSPY